MLATIGGPRMELTCVLDAMEKSTWHLSHVNGSRGERDDSRRYIIKYNKNKFDAFKIVNESLARMKTIKN
jgi:hypothetical protein